MDINSTCAFKPLVDLQVLQAQFAYFRTRLEFTKRFLSQQASNHSLCTFFDKGKDPPRQEFQAYV